MRKIIVATLFLGVIAAFSAGVLSWVNHITAGKILAQQEAVAIEAQKNVLPSAVSFKDQEAVLEKPRTVIAGGKEAYQFVPGVDAQGKLVGYTVAVSSTGYSSTIEFIMGISLSGSVTGIQITSQKETPGLGDKITQPAWEMHWKGTTQSSEFNKPIDAFAGSTISPEAVYHGMMNALEAFSQIQGG